MQSGSSDHVFDSVTLLTCDSECQSWYFAVSVGESEFVIVEETLRHYVNVFGYFAIIDISS